MKLAKIENVVKVTGRLMSRKFEVREAARQYLAFADDLVIYLPEVETNYRK